MSILRADSIRNREGTGAPNFPNGVTITGVATATSFSGNLTGNVTGNVTGNATGISGTPSISVNALTASSATINGTTTINGNLTVDGTTTSIDTVNLVIEDKNIGIGTTTAPSNTTADGAGFTIFGGSSGDKTLDRKSTRLNSSHIPLSRMPSSA